MAVAPAPALSLSAAAGGGSLLFRQLFDGDTGTFTYLLADVPSRKGVIIDTVFEQHGRDLSLVRELGIDLVASIDTHAHADHVTGSWLMHEATGCAIGLAAAARAENVTLPLAHGDRINFGARFVEVRATPGHTDGCISFVLDDQSMAFTGDALLVRGCGRCDFQQGNAHTLWTSITGQILSLPERCLLYPGHDYTGRGVTSVAEEKAFNARLGGDASERDFVGHMENMKLPHPHKIAEALPGNMRSGKPREGGRPSERDHRARRALRRGIQRTRWASGRQPVDPPAGAREPLQRDPHRSPARGGLSFGQPLGPGHPAAAQGRPPTGGQPPRRPEPLGC
jgi:glyoxylase-like metal-dependent hydrolase (beta-lactamase superfamily II)